MKLCFFHALVLLLLLPPCAFTANAQGADFISIRKRTGRTLKSFYPTTYIAFETEDGRAFQGDIHAIRNDSVLVNLYNIRIYTTYLGVTAVDTVGRTVAGVHYRQIRHVQLSYRPQFRRAKFNKLLRYGGAGYFALNVANGVLGNEPLLNGKNLHRLGMAAGAFLLGTVWKRLQIGNGFSRRHHRIHYIRLDRPRTTAPV